MENYSAEFHSRKAEKIRKGQFGPTQRENNATRTQLVLTEAK